MWVVGGETQSNCPGGRSIMGEGGGGRVGGGEGRVPRGSHDELSPGSDLVVSSLNQLRTITSLCIVFFTERDRILLLLYRQYLIV